MRKISEKELKKRGVKLKSDDLGRIASSKTSKAISDVSKAMQETVQVLAQISKEVSKEVSSSPAIDTSIIKHLEGRKDSIQKVEIVGGNNDKPAKTLRVRVTKRDRGGNIAEMIMEQI